MDSGVTPRRSCCLAGILPSTYPPPLGERDRQSKWTTSHIDLHTMGDHEEGITEPPSPIPMKDGEFTPTYDPSPDMTKLGLVIFEIGTFHDRPTYSSVDPPLMHRRYGILEEDEIHFEREHQLWYVWFSHT